MTNALACPGTRIVARNLGIPRAINRTRRVYIYLISRYVPMLGLLGPGGPDGVLLRGGRDIERFMRTCMLCIYGRRNTEAHDMLLSFLLHISMPNKIA